jgi:hypothetical protein
MALTTAIAVVLPMNGWTSDGSRVAPTLQVRASSAFRP